MRWKNINFGTYLNINMDVDCLVFDARWDHPTQVIFMTVNCFPKKIYTPWGAVTYP